MLIIKLKRNRSATIVEHLSRIAKYCMHEKYPIIWKCPLTGTGSIDVCSLCRGTIYLTCSENWHTKQTCMTNTTSFFVWKQCYCASSKYIFVGVNSKQIYHSFYTKNVAYAMKMKAGFRNTQWDPFLLCTQIIAMQAILYVNLGAIMAFMDIFVDANHTLDHIFQYHVGSGAIHHQ